MTLKAVNLTRDTERQREALDVCEELALGDYGSGVNALLVLIRKSPLYRETLEKLKRKNDQARQPA